MQVPFLALQALCSYLLFTYLLLVFNEAQTCLYLDLTVAALLAIVKHTSEVYRLLKQPSFCQNLKIHFVPKAFVAASKGLTNITIMVAMLYLVVF